MTKLLWLLPALAFACGGTNHPEACVKHLVYKPADLWLDENSLDYVDHLFSPYLNQGAAVNCAVNAKPNTYCAKACLNSDFSRSGNAEVAKCFMEAI